MTQWPTLAQTKTTSLELLPGLCRWVAQLSSSWAIFCTILRPLTGSQNGNRVGSKLNQLSTCDSSIAGNGFTWAITIPGQGKGFFVCFEAFLLLIHLLSIWWKFCEIRSYLKQNLYQYIFGEQCWRHVVKYYLHWLFNMTLILPYSIFSLLWIYTFDICMCMFMHAILLLVFQIKL